MKRHLRPATVSLHSDTESLIERRVSTLVAAAQNPTNRPSTHTTEKTHEH